jgi:hypothetical protein
VTPARWLNAAGILAEAQADPRIGTYTRIDLHHAEVALRFLAAIDTAELDAQALEIAS